MYTLPQVQPDVVLGSVLLATRLCAGPGNWRGDGEVQKPQEGEKATIGYAISAICALVAALAAAMAACYVVNGLLVFGVIEAVMAIWLLALSIAIIARVVSKS